WRPACRQALEQVELCERGVLELVDEDVANPRIEREGKVRRLLHSPERAQGAKGILDVIGSLLLLKNDVQLCDGERQHIEQRFHNLPLLVVVGDGWKRPYRFELLAKARILGELAQQGLHARLQ